MNAVANRTIARLKLGLVTSGLLALSSTACSVGPVTSVGAAEPPRVPPVYAGESICRPTGPAVVLAQRVFVPGGVEATEQEGRFAVRFSARKSRCVAVEWPSASEPEPPHPASCPAPAARTVAEISASEAMLALNSREEPEGSRTFGIGTSDVRSDAPHALFDLGIEPNPYDAARTFHAPAANRDAFATAPDFAPIGHDRFLLAWVEGSVEEHHLVAQAVVGWGDPLGNAMALSPSDASVIGRPSMAVAPTGRGLVTYIASIDGRFEVLATPVACAMN